MLTIIGCGNANRSDDAVGVEVARRVRDRLAASTREDVQVFDCGTAGMEVMFAARGTEHLIIVDASKSGSEPGTIYNVPGEELEQEYRPSLNLHDFRWDHALAAGRQIFADEYPERVEVFLIEAEELGLGLEL
ncbi:MAG: hydrogenase maturation protease, partial [Myxococcota bacterium]